MTSKLHTALWVEESRDGRLHGVFRGEPIDLAASDDALPAAFRLDPAEATRLQLEEDVFNYVDAARSNLDRWLTADVAGALVANGLGQHALIELCHLMTSLPRHMSVAAAECHASDLQQVFIKNLIHHDRFVPSWDGIIAHVTGAAPALLSPLPSTFAFQLALEDVAARDRLAYAAAASLFGGAGRMREVERVVTFAKTLAAGDRAVAEIVDDWAQSILSHHDSYASVDELRDIGYPSTEDMLRLASRSLSPLSWLAVEQACDLLRIIDDHFRLFVGGLRIYFKDRSESWPRVKIDWLVR
jgi:hypothetical protein